MELSATDGCQIIINQNLLYIVSKPKQQREKEKRKKTQEQMQKESHLRSLEEDIWQNIYNTALPALLCS